MTSFRRVKFERPATGEVVEGLLAWDTGDVQFLTTWVEVKGHHVGPITVEVTRQGSDGIFRRVTDYTLDQMGEDVLRMLRELAADANRL